MNHNLTIIPVAGGKGGVGKTLIAANLAAALAEVGDPVIAADLDLGGSNLHSYLGLSNDHPGIGDFLKAHSGDLAEMLVETEDRNLRLLLGDGRSPFMANIPHVQKVRLLLKLRALEARWLILDIGAGTSFNTLDFFGVAPNGIVVTTPEFPAIMNMMVFLKNFIFRVIDRAAGKRPDVRELLRRRFSQPMSEEPLTAQTLLGEIAALNDEAGAAAAAACAAYRPRIVFNMGDHPDELRVLPQIDRNLRQTLGLEAEFFGFIFQDRIVRQSVNRRQTLMRHFRDSVVAEGLAQMADRLRHSGPQPTPNSAEHLQNSAARFFEQHIAKPE